jgi:hypothetical protein
MNNYWIIISLIILLITSIATILICIYDKVVATKEIIITFIIMYVIILIPMIVGGLIAKECIYSKCKIPFKEIANESTKIDLVAINDYIGFKSNTYLCLDKSTASESSDEYKIRYAYKSDDGTIKTDCLDVDKLDVGFVEDNQNILETRIERETSKYRLNDLGQFLFNDNKVHIDENVLYFGTSAEYIFHIPKNSIPKDFKIDLK